MTRNKKKRNACRLAVSADVGGTYLKAGLIDRSGRLRHPLVLPTEAGRGKDFVISRLSDVIHELVRKAGGKDGVIGIGLGVTGQVDYRTGKIIGGLESKIPGWIGTPIKEIMEHHFNLPTFVDNDGNVAAIGELLVGAGRGVKDMVCLTIGTGIGSGIIVRGKLLRKATGSAGEVGHVSIAFDGPPCGCGSTGCLELYASASAMIRRTMAEIKRGTKTIIASLANGNLESVNIATIRDAAERGDRFALNLIRDMAFYLGAGLTNVVNILGPELIIIGGGITPLVPFLIKELTDVIKTRAFYTASDDLRVVASQLGPYAGVIGAGLMVFQELEETQSVKGAENEA